MPKEDAINGVLAAVLSREYKVHALPEHQTKLNSKRKYPDIRIHEKHGDKYFTAVECKIGQDTSTQKEAINSARRWLENSECWNTIALCYPEKFGENTSVTLYNLIESSKCLLMAKVSHDGVVGKDFHKGNLSDLIDLSANIDEETKNTRLVTNILETAIKDGANYLSEKQNKILADRLEIPYNRKKAGKVPKPARIACLILANTMLLQNRLNYSSVEIEGGLQNLIEINDNHLFSSLQQTLLENWKKIRKKNYAPVIDPAILIIKSLTPSHSTSRLLYVLLNAVIRCASLILKVQTDYIGPLYHGLLDTARYDGSFYTNVSTSVLLSELAITPEWFNEITQSDINNVSKIKICDPACGTGTLLMSSARSIKRRIKENESQDQVIEEAVIHRYLVEDVLHGWDINRHAIHLSASMLTMNAPTIDYNKMNLLRMHHGVDPDGQTRAGSIDILVGEGLYMQDQITYKDHAIQERITAEGTTEYAPNLDGKCDIVIMNPPFTRNDIRNKHLPSPIEKKVRDREKTVASLVKSKMDGIKGNAIVQDSINSFFTPIADQLLKVDKGTLAAVQPTTTFTSASGTGCRMLLINRFHIHLVITSHDNNNINFSGNTRIHETLLIAKRPEMGMKEQKTAFISLKKNPTDTFEAQKLSGAIRKSLKGETSTLQLHYGSIFFENLNTEEFMRGDGWNQTSFYNQILSKQYREISKNQNLTPLVNVIGRQKLYGSGSVRNSFHRSEEPQYPDIRALWFTKSEREKFLKTEFDTYLMAKKGKKSNIKLAQKKKSHLLLPEKMYLKATRTSARFVEHPSVGSHFLAVCMADVTRNINFTRSEVKGLCKAYCLWFNSTYGILSFLNIRSRKLTYPDFAISYLESLPVPKLAKRDLPLLIKNFDEIAEKELRPLPEMHLDPVRKEIDQIIRTVVLGLPDAKELRILISQEPSVHGRK